MWFVWKDNNFNYYHYQPGSNIVIVYCKHITHARTHTPSSPFRLSLFDGSVELTPLFAGRWFIKICTRAGDPVSRSFECFSRIKKLLGRTETRTRDSQCVQSIRTVWDISRDDRASIATSSLLTQTDRCKENYSIGIPKLTWFLLLLSAERNEERLEMWLKDVVPKRNIRIYKQSHMIIIIMAGMAVFLRGWLPHRGKAQMACNYCFPTRTMF